jgi:hypothetical protein
MSCDGVTFGETRSLPRDPPACTPSHRPVAEAIGAAAERIVVFDI